MLGPPPLRQQWQCAADRPRQGGTATQPPSKPSTPNMRRLVYPQPRADPPVRQVINSLSIDYQQRA